MPYAELDGLRLYYERAGRGDPEMLFVPGWCCDGTAFQPQFDYFAQRNAVTALDLRGQERSPTGRLRNPRPGRRRRRVLPNGGHRAADRRRTQPRRDDPFRQLTSWDGTEPFARCDVPALLL